MPKPRVVIDANVWISAALTRSGAPAQLMRRVIGQAQPVLTPDTFEELKQRLWLPKFDRYVTMEARKQILHDIDAVAFWVDVSQAVAQQTFCCDADDDKFIHAALAVGAGWLITGDQDLLVLSEILLPAGVRVVSPADALQVVEFLPVNQ